MTCLTQFSAMEHILSEIHIRGKVDNNLFLKYRLNSVTKQIVLVTEFC
jgi:hypothetical protein